MKFPFEIIDGIGLAFDVVSCYLTGSNAGQKSHIDTFWCTPLNLKYKTNDS